MKNKVKYSNNYDQFKMKYGNRSVSRKRVQTIKDSIEKIGWFCDPILVNEKMEIIDGQHRFEALKELGLDIEYTVTAGADLEEARTLNSCSKNWTTQNYIDSYAADGDINYINLRNLEKKYPKLDMSTLISVAKGSLGTTVNTRGVQAGRFTLPTERLTQIYDALDYVMANIESIQRIEGRRRNIVSCIVWVVINTPASRERLSKVLHRTIFPPVSDAVPKRFLESLSEAYNKGLGKEKRIKFDALYELSL